MARRRAAVQASIPDVPQFQPPEFSFPLPVPESPEPSLCATVESLQLDGLTTFSPAIAANANTNAGTTDASVALASADGRDVAVIASSVSPCKPPCIKREPSFANLQIDTGMDASVFCSFDTKAVEESLRAGKPSRLEDDAVLAVPERTEGVFAAGDLGSLAQVARAKLQTGADERFPNLPARACPVSPGSTCSYSASSSDGGGDEADTTADTTARDDSSKESVASIAFGDERPVRVECGRGTSFSSMMLSPQPAAIRLYAPPPGNVPCPWRLGGFLSSPGPRSLELLSPFGDSLVTPTPVGVHSTERPNQAAPAEVEDTGKGSLRVDGKQVQRESKFDWSPAAVQREVHKSINAEESVGGSTAQGGGHRRSKSLGQTHGSTGGCDTPEESDSSAVGMRTDGGSGCGNCQTLIVPELGAEPEIESPGLPTFGSAASSASGSHCTGLPARRCRQAMAQSCPLLPRSGDKDARRSFGDVVTAFSPPRFSWRDLHDWELANSSCSRPGHL
eukprot:TRINITY_DN25137_c2_g2_i1.p1 TRINITY_DN25137_c2_g2~~TRINITY_DN25137_c2_g2_i1.p1  ORF type:complete len:539 (+),score=76.51 TRINITY_DN25137_c2_g2_i1:99-1619(+)